jgi:hypothetical protein
LFQLGVQLLNDLGSTLNQLIGVPTREITIAVGLPLVVDISTEAKNFTWIHSPIVFSSTTRMSYDNNVWRGVASQSVSSYRDTNRLDLQDKFVHSNSKKNPSDISNFFSQANLLSLERSSLFSRSLNVISGEDDSWKEGNLIVADTDTRFQELLPCPVADEEVYEFANPLSVIIQDKYIELIPLPNGADVVWGTTDRVSKDTGLSYGQGSSTSIGARFSFEEGRLLDAFPWEWRTVSPPLPIPSTSVNLLFECPWQIDNHLLNFSAIPCIRKKYIIERRFYYMLHTIHLTRLSDNQEIQLSRVTASTDEDSYTWRFDLTILGKDSYDALMAYSPMELELSINSWTWKLVLVNIQESKKFGSNVWSATGVGFPIYLSESYSDKTSFIETSSKTIQQLAEAQVNGTTWTIDWDAPNWLVPANTWRYADKTPIENIAELAKTAGGIILADRVNKNLQIKQKFPSAPWNFGSLVADIVLPLDPIMSQDRSLKRGKNYNAVYAMGTTDNGIIGLIKKTGTAGDKQPSAPISHSLITHIDGAAAYGSRFIYENLDCYQYNITLPLIENDIPLVDVGALLRVSETVPWDGLITRVSVTAGVSSKSVSVRQSFNVDRYII